MSMDLSTGIVLFRSVSVYFFTVCNTLSENYKKCFFSDLSLSLLVKVSELNLWNRAKIRAYWNLGILMIRELANLDLVTCSGASGVLGHPLP